ncbi:MAG: hypothetical protein WA071_23465 [Undibacterium umbellatum]|uniref:hypothetical protein n=1 Tax=Undibacterium umbellatum TaxID=2762300 RepID=UPI003BB7EB10
MPAETWSQTKSKQNKKYGIYNAADLGRWWLLFSLRGMGNENDKNQIGVEGIPSINVQLIFSGFAYDED